MALRQSELREIQADAEKRVFNLLLTALTEFASWPEPTREWVAVAADLERERLRRADLANYMMTKIEAEIQHAKEAIVYHQIQYFSRTGREAENHLTAIETFRTFIKRLELSKNNIHRLVATIWPFPQMLRAALSESSERTTRTVLPPAQIRQLRDAMKKIATAQPPPPPAEEFEEAPDSESKSKSTEDKE